jgi:hypothetical protein
MARTPEEDGEYWRERHDKLELALLELADHFGLGLFYECNKPGVMGWWWEYGERGTPQRLTMKGGYIDDLPDAIENYFKVVGFKGKNYIPRG